MATFQITIGPETVTLNAANTKSIKLIRGYCLAHNAPADLTDPQRIEWFMRHLLNMAKNIADDAEVNEAARTAAEMKRTENAGDVFT